MSLYLDAAMVAAWPEHDRMADADDVAAGDAQIAADYRRRIAALDALRAEYGGEDFEYEVRRVMWEERCDEPTAVHRAGADRRLGVYRRRAVA
jgi:hypothetical protein